MIRAGGESRLPVGSSATITSITSSGDRDAAAGRRTFRRGGDSAVCDAQELTIRSEPVLIGVFPRGAWQRMLIVRPVWAPS